MKHCCKAAHGLLRVRVVHSQDSRGHCGQWQGWDSLRYKSMNHKNGTMDVIIRRYNPARCCFVLRINVHYLVGVWRYTELTRRYAILSRLDFHKIRFSLDKGFFIKQNNKTLQRRFWNVLKLAFINSSTFFLSVFGIQDAAEAHYCPQWSQIDMRPQDNFSNGKYRHDLILRD